MRRPSAVLATLAVTLLVHPALGQTAPVNGIRTSDVGTHAIVGATIVVAPGQVVENATIVFRDGIIEAVGPDVIAPPEARTWPGAGLTVYPGLIDAAVLVEATAPAESPGRHWNAKVHPELRISDGAGVSIAARKAARETGFTAGAVYPESGIFRGSGAVISFANGSSDVSIYRDPAAMAVSFERSGDWNSPATPGSLMGSIALVRQTLLDAQWHTACRTVYAAHPEGNDPPIPADALVALAPALRGEQPVLFDVANELDALRAVRVARAFELDAMLLGSGTEFRRLDEIAALGVPIILPLRYPERPDVSDPHVIDRTTLRELMTWEQAPTNPRRLIEANVPVAFTAHGLKRRAELPGAVHKAILHGLSEDDALAALTTVPARLLGVDRVMGTLEPGKLANLVVVEGELFVTKPKIRDTWIGGERYEIDPAPPATVAFAGRLETDGGRVMRVDLDTAKPSAVFHIDDTGETTAKAKKVTVRRNQVGMLVDGRPFEVEGYVQLSGLLAGDTLTGGGTMPDGRRFTFTLVANDAWTAELAGAAKAAVGDGDADGIDGIAGVVGTWVVDVELPDAPVAITLRLEREDEELTGTAEMMQASFELEDVVFDASTGEIDFRFDGPGGAIVGDAVLVAGAMTGTLTGERMNAPITGQREAADAIEEDDAFVMPPDRLVTPLGAYGITREPIAGDLLITNATIWTAGEAGIIENGSMLVVDGRIVAIGAGGPDELGLPRQVAGATVLDLDGRHVTPGLIDCHSHTGISGGVNEFPQANTAEVRIGDVVNPDDVNWYRQLAGGLTTANLLHGSANPIGGQNAVVKLKWGGAADDFLVDDAPGGIKFALGENVKRSRNRYPNTRMGVETFIRDAFTAAQDYTAEWARYEALPANEQARTMPPQRDLELEALVEIIAGERLVHCHSYRQDEILALIRIAETFGFTIGTFQHVLEGYKVAEAIAAHGAGASSFSDWWAYKVEVMDAIPQNGSLMTDVGVLVSFNSDSSELARRMNTEAAKAVRYGGLDPHEALELVTLNPARQLGIGDRTGSLEVGKDADFAVWSTSPLSTYAMCEQTWIEGARYFDLESDRAHRARIAAERQRILQRILTDVHGDPPTLVQNDADDADDAETPPPATLAGRRLDPETIRWMEDQVRLGHDPFEIRPGECGCGVLGLHAGEHAH